MTENDGAMQGSGPAVLVVDDDRDERTAIASVLCEAGFAVVAAEKGDAGAALERKYFAAAVIALAKDDAVEFLHQARRGQPGLKALIVTAPAETWSVDQARETLVPRPLDPRQLLGCLLELVLREEGERAAPRHRDAAELGIAAAQLACLDNRRAAATAVGASRLARDLARQIDETTARHRRPAAAARAGGVAVTGQPAG